MSKIFGRYLFIHFGPLIAFMQMCIPSLRDIRLKDQQRDGGGGGTILPETTDQNG